MTALARYHTLGSLKISRSPGSQRLQALIHHWRWLEANGYKKEAASCKRQAASLTKKLYPVITSYKLKERE